MVSGKNAQITSKEKKNYKVVLYNYNQLTFYNLLLLKVKAK